MNKKIFSQKKQLKKIFDKYITAEQYGDFKEILDEILYRRAITFGFSNDQMMKEAKNLSENLKRIYFYKGNPEDETLGYYHLNDKEIHFNTLSAMKLLNYLEKKDIPNVIKNEVLGLDIFQILSHEVYHAISPKGITERREYNGDKLKFTSNRTAINEIVTESASNIAACPIQIPSEDGFLISRGYPELTYAGALLSCALNVSENELYKWSLNNREEYKSFIETKLYKGTDNSTYINYEDFLDFYLKSCMDKNSIGKVDFIELITGITAVSIDICNQESWQGINNINAEILGKEYTKYKRFNLILNTYIKTYIKNSQNIYKEKLIEKLTDSINTIKRRTSNIYLLYYISKNTDYALNEDTIVNALIGKEIDLSDYKDLPDSVKIILKNSSEDNIELMLNEFKNSKEFNIAQDNIIKTQKIDKSGYNQSIYGKMANIFYVSLKESNAHYIVTPQEIAKADISQQISSEEIRKFPKLIQTIKNKLLKDRSDDY